MQAHGQQEIISKQATNAQNVDINLLLITTNCKYQLTTENMFIFDKSKWIKSKDGQPSYYCSAVDNLMIPYKISCKKFLVNMDCMSNGYSYSFNYSQASTFSMVFFAEGIKSWELPLGFPDWFYWAFPDVAYWLIKENGMDVIMKRFKNLGEDEISDPSNGRIKISLLKEFIELYKSMTGKQLEVCD